MRDQMDFLIGTAEDAGIMSVLRLTRMTRCAKRGGKLCGEAIATMTQKPMTCPKCSGQMESGFMLDRGAGPIDV